jgi:hypothetical protein
MKKTLNEEKNRILEIMKIMTEGWRTVKNDAGEPIGTEYEKDAFDPQDQPEYEGEPEYERGVRTHLSDFRNIDWKIFHEELLLNEKDTKDAYNVNDYIDDGLMSEEDFDLLEENGLIRFIDVFPVLGSEEYRDYQTFYNKAKEIWNKRTHNYYSGNDSEAPYLRGREPES